VPELDCLYVAELVLIPALVHRRHCGRLGIHPETTERFTVGNPLRRDLALPVHIENEIFGPSVIRVILVKLGGLEVDHVLHRHHLVVALVPDGDAHAPVTQFLDRADHVGDDVVDADVALGDLAGRKPVIDCLG
jgi:hypothetical protein